MILEETTLSCDIAKVHIGSVWTRHDTGKVIDIQGTSIRIRNAAGQEWTITDTLVESQFSFADQHDQEVKVTRTEMINILKNCRQTAMTVVYHKKPDEGIIAKAVASGQGDLTDKQWKSVVKRLIQGEERTMIGCHYGGFDDHERLKFQEAGVGIRLVDTRTLMSVIVKRVFYRLK